MYMLLYINQKLSRGTSDQSYTNLWQWLANQQAGPSVYFIKKLNGGTSDDIIIIYVNEYAWYVSGGVSQ